MLTNGWDSSVRRATAEHFNLDFDELQSRHHLTFDTYEVGKITFDTFLDRIVFYQPRKFTREAFKQFVYEFAKPLPGMIELFAKLKAKHNLKIAVVSNEGRELMYDRVARFDLKSLVDFFIVSSFVHLRKPDTDIYNLALDVAMLEPAQVAYIDDRAMLVEVASKMGIVGIQHTNYEATVDKLAALGLTL